jgi:hypothetical protein
MNRGLCCIAVLLGIWNVFGAQIGLTPSQKEAPTNEWGAVTYNTQVSLGLKRPERPFRTNEVVELLVRIKNLSTNEEYGIAVQSPLTLSDGLSFDVHSPSGKNISPVFRGSPRLSGGVVWVHPNETDGFAFPLGEICKTDEVGIYTVTLKIERRTPDRRKSFEIVSKPLFISVGLGR